MIIKAPKTAKDLAQFHNHGPAFSRRDFLTRAIALGAVGIVGPQLGVSNMAYAAGLVCPPSSSLVPGGFAQIYMSGGPAVVPILPLFLSNAVNASTAPVYGLSGAANLMPAGGNWMTDKTSPWGNVLMAGPAGVNAATWAQILKDTYIGGHYGDLGQDDGTGQDEGLVAGFALINGKGGPNPKDIHFKTTNVRAAYAVGPTVAPTALTPTALAATLQMTPSATGLTTQADLASVNTAAVAIEAAYESVKPISGIKGGSNLITAAGCGFNNNPPTASAAYGAANYVPSGITNITNLIPATTLAATGTVMSLQNQAILAASYQSALGFNGGVMFTNPNCDYHGAGNQETANQDQTNANTVVAMLAGFAAAGKPGVIQINSNGFAVSSGVGQATITINGTATTVQSPTAEGDAGGTFSQNLLLFYSPGVVPNVKTLGSINVTTGAVKGATGSPANSMVGAAASVLYFLNNGKIPNAFLTASGMSAAQLTPLMCIS